MLPQNEFFPLNIKKKFTCTLSQRRFDEKLILSATFVLTKDFVHYGRVMHFLQKVIYSSFGGAGINFATAETEKRESTLLHI